MSTTLSRHYIEGLLCTCFAFGLVPYRFRQLYTGGWGGSVGAIAIATTRPSLLSAPFYALPGCVHTSLIRTGVFCGCSGDGSPKRLDLGTAPALFPSSPRQIPSRKHFICGSGKAYVGSESAVWKAAANRLCNVFGGVVLVFTVSADLWQAEPPPQ